MVLIGEEHHEPVDADPKPSGWGESVFQRDEIVFVDRMGLVVAAGARPSLALEPSPLVERIVELGEGDGVFRTGDEQLESFGQVWFSRWTRANGEVSLG